MILFVNFDFEVSTEMNTHYNPKISNINHPNKSIKNLHSLISRIRLSL